MSIRHSVLKFIAALFHIPPTALDYYLATGHIGHGAETLLPFPAELIPVGARLVLRGWYNNKFLPTNLDWILPYWAERQFDPQDAGFIPRGFNLYTINYTHRDWTMIGNLASEREPIVDPRGLVTPWFDGWSLDVWLRVDGKLYAPSHLPEGAVVQKLDETRSVPTVVTTFAAGNLNVTLEAFVASEGDGGEWVVEDVTVENSGAGTPQAVLYVSVRPFNPEGVSLVRDLEYRRGPDGERAAIRVNHALGAVLPKPEGIACADFPDGDVALALPALNGKTRVTSASGLATAVVSYPFELGPGRRYTISVRMPVAADERDDDDPALLAPLAHLSPSNALRDAATAVWREKLGQGMRVRLPDEKLQQAFEANKAFLLLLHDGDSITPGPFTYHQFWFRDSAYLLNALDKLGYHAESRQVLERFPRRLEKSGYVRATEGEWDSNGAAIWAMVENARLSGDKELVARHYWSLLSMAAWIHSKRQQTKSKRGPRSPHHGLLPSGPGAEHLGPSDYFYWDDFWGLAGLRESAQVADWLGLGQDASRLRANLESFRRDVDASLATAAARLGRPAMPASPYRRLDAGMIGNLAALYPLRHLKPDDARIVDTLAALQQYASSEGIYFNHAGHSAFGTYLTLHEAQCYLFQRDPEAWRIIQWVLAHASPTFTWAEGIHPLTRRGGMGDGHHGWALADFLLAIRNLLLFEEDTHLVLTPVLPQDWTAENSVIQVQDAATYFGRVSFTIAFGERTGTLVINGDWHTAPEYVEWNWPFALREAGGDVDGVEIVGQTVRLPRGAQRVVVMW